MIFIILKNLFTRYFINVERKKHKRLKKNLELKLKEKKKLPLFFKLKREIHFQIKQKQQRTNPQNLYLYIIL